MDRPSRKEKARLASDRCLDSLSIEVHARFAAGPLPTLRLRNVFEIISWFDNKVIPAKAGIQTSNWIPAFAGMTKSGSYLNRILSWLSEFVLVGDHSSSIDNRHLANMVPMRT